MDFNKELTNEEIKQINEATQSIGDFGEVKIVKNGSTIDLLQTKRIRLRNGKSTYNKG